MMHLLFLIFSMAHFSACIFHYIGNFAANTNENSWIKERHLEDSIWQLRYLEALYYSFITMITVGYGDVTP